MRLYYNIKRFLSNVKLFTKLAWKWRPWDYEYTVAVLCELLKAQARHSIRHGVSVTSEHYARKMYNAAYKLDIAYLRDDSIYSDSLHRYLKSHPPKNVKLASGLTSITFDKTEVEEKFYRKNVKKHDDVMKQRREEAFKYLGRYLLCFWD